MSSIQSWFPVAGHLHLAHSIVLQNSSSPGAGNTSASISRLRPLEPCRENLLLILFFLQITAL